MWVEGPDDRCENSIHLELVVDSVFTDVFEEAIMRVCICGKLSPPNVQRNESPHIGNRYPEERVILLGYRRITDVGTSRDATGAGHQYPRQAPG
jgi:hypothetical protein